MTELINIHNLCYRIGEQTVLNNIELVASSGEIIIIKGPSGCGKTTLLRILSGLLVPDQGQILLDGQVANNPKIIIPAYQRGISMLFQDLALWPSIRGLDQLKIAHKAYPAGEHLDTLIAELKNKIDLSDEILLKYPSELSRGQQQRLAVARAVIGRAPILIMDEPFTGLDQDLRDKLSEYIEFLRRDYNTTVLIVSHDLISDVIKADRKYLFHDNTLISVERESSFSAV